MSRWAVASALVSAFSLGGILGIQTGRSIGRGFADERWQREAVRHDAASYHIADPSTGRVEWRWREETVPVPTTVRVCDEWGQEK